MVEGRWQPGEAGIYSEQFQAPEHVLWLNLLDPVTGVTRVIEKIPTNALLSFDAPVFTITRDGKRIVFSEYDHHRQDLHMFRY